MMSIRSALSLLVLLLPLLAPGCAAFLVRHPRTFRGALNEGLRARGVKLEASSADPAPLNYTQQTVDHFDRTDLRTWNQKYYVNNSFYGGAGSPLFLVLGGEGPVSPAYVTGHFVTGLLAQTYGAAQVALEHRFYGDSMPVADSSSASLSLLSSEQALADAAQFTSWYVAQNNITGPVVVFGGSYSGSLASWARQKYPSVFQGAYATSGPLHAKVDFYEYFQVVQTSVGPACAAALSAGSNQLAAMLTNAPGRTALQTMFQTCSPIESTNDQYMLASAVTGSISGVVQYSNDNVKYQPYNVAAMCEIMLNASNTPLQNMAVINQNVNEHTGVNCTEVNYTAFIEESQPSSAGRSWTWQTCVEFGWYQAADGPDQPFNTTILPLPFYIQMCQDMFGTGAVPAEPDTTWTNTAYGSTTVRATNTFFPNGNVDPWHVLGMYDHFLPFSSMYFLINGTAHCADLYPPAPTDPASLTQARQLGSSLISQWINDFVPVSTRLA